MSEQLRQAIRDGRMIREGKRRGRHTTVIVCDDPDRPTTDEDRARLKRWIEREVER